MEKKVFWTLLRPYFLRIFFLEGFVSEDLGTDTITARASLNLSNGVLAIAIAAIYNIFGRFMLGDFLR